MKKLLPIIIAIGALIGSLVYYDTEKTSKMEESLYLNQDFIEFYEIILEESNLSEEEKQIYKESYRTFLIWSSNEYREYDPNEYLLEE